MSRLGAGGFASVWLYRDETLHSLVAVKALADNWSQRSDVRERFLEEARILRRADSDHVVRVYDIGETADGTPYFVMSYADGGTVGDLLPQAPLPLGQVADLVSQASSGLSVLHGIGVVHRDVKPQNLLLQNTGADGVRLVVADLGVAKAMAYASGLTQVVGTPAYMAPEQADPGVGLDTRADVHALGAVAYHLLTGHVIRSGSVESVARAGVPVPPTHLVADLPAEIDHVVGRAVHPDREQRWVDVSSFAAALRDVAAGAGQRTLLTQPIAQLSPGRRRSRLRWLAPLALLLAVTAAIAGWYAVARTGSPDTPEVPDPIALGMTLPPPWAESERDASTVTYRQPERDLLVRLSVAGGSATPESTAGAELDRLRPAEGFTPMADEPLPTNARTGWEDGWLIRYSYVLDGRRRVQEAWYVGEGGTTAGFVAAAAPAAGPAAITTLLPRALAALPPPSAPQVTGSPDFSGTYLSTDLRGQERSDVALVQARLNDLGYGPIPTDGDYESAVASSVRQYQVDRGLFVDARIGPQTWGSLFP